MQALNREARIYSGIHWQITRQQVNRLNSLSSNEIGLKNGRATVCSLQLLSTSFAGKLRYFAVIRNAKPHEQH